jgi:hypothetical protein
MKSTYKIIIILPLLAGIVSCKKFIEVDPPVTTVNAENVYRDNSTAAAVTTSVFARMSNTFSTQGITSVSLVTDLSADNLTLWENGNIFYQPIYQNALNPNNATFWNGIYQTIYECNAVLEGLSNSTTLTESVKQRLTGEAYFSRAFNYFYLVNLYGDVPLVLSTDYKVNNQIGRTAVATVYQQIIDDLSKAKDLLGDQYLGSDILTPTEDRIRPNRAAALAMLARVQLYIKKYTEAETAATAVINQNTIYATASVPLDQVFLKNSLETIWALQPVKTGYNTDEAQIFVLPSGGPNNATNKFYASSQLMASFDSIDKRLISWFGNITVAGKDYPYVAKYKAKQGSALTEYTIVLRLAEQYLIRAEARANMGQLSTAIDDIDIIRSRAGLPLIKETNPNINKDDLLLAILKERRNELFTEWGHRWFDLRRTEKIDAVMTEVTPTKGGSSWESYKALYPLPNAQLAINNVLKQNPGYTN